MSEPIKAVLDASAITAYSRGSINVGEVISEVASEGGLVGLPVLALVEAAGMGADRGLLDLLTEHPSTVVLPVEEDWLALVAMHDLVARLDAASAALAAYDEGAYLLTATPSWYAGWADGASVIGI